MPRLLITVDTEISNFPRSMGLWGRVDGEDWGLGRLIDTFDEIEARGTFFLDAYAGNDDDLREDGERVRRPQPLAGVPEHVDD